MSKRLAVCYKSDFEQGKILPGTALLVQRLSYKHYGIYYGKKNGVDFVLHYSDKFKSGRGIVECIELERFVKKDSCYVEHHNGFEYSDELCAKSLKRAISRLGEKEYNIFTNNCEHFSTWCVTGKSQSDQLAELVQHIKSSPHKFILRKSQEMGLLYLKKNLKKTSSNFTTNACIAGLFMLRKVLNKNCSNQI